MSRWKNKLIKLQKKLEDNLEKTYKAISEAESSFNLGEIECLKAKEFYLKLFKKDVDLLLKEDEK